MGVLETGGGSEILMARVVGCVRVMETRRRTTDIQTSNIGTKDTQRKTTHNTRRFFLFLSFRASEEACITRYWNCAVVVTIIIIMARQLVGDAKPSWQMDIDDLEHQKNHFQKELTEMLESDDINVATDEDEHEKLREKMREIDVKIQKIRTENENKPSDGGAEPQGDGSDQDEVPDEDAVQVEEVPFDALEAQAKWREWKRELPKDKYFYAKGFARQLGGNGSLAHDSETVTEEVLAQTDIAHKTMQATRKVGCWWEQYKKRVCSTGLVDDFE